MKFDVFDSRAEQLGATSESQKAELAGVDRVTLWRWRKGHLTPSLDNALAIAKRLGVPLSDIIRGDVA